MNDTNILQIYMDRVRTVKNSNPCYNCWPFWHTHHTRAISSWPWSVLAVCITKSGQLWGPGQPCNKSVVRPKWLVQWLKNDFEGKSLENKYLIPHKESEATRTWGSKKSNFLYAIRHERNYLMAAGKKVVLFELGLWTGQFWNPLCDSCKNWIAQRYEYMPVDSTASFAGIIAVEVVSLSPLSLRPFQWRLDDCSG